MMRTAISPRLATSRQSKRGLVRSELMPSHPEDAVARRRQRCAARSRREPQAEHSAGIGRIDNAVVPEPGGGVIRRALLLVLGANRRGERLLLLARPRATAGLDAIPAYGRQNGRRLFAAHDGNPGVRPHPQEAWVVRTAAHAVIAGAEGTADDDGEFGDDRARHRCDQLGAVLGDAAVLVLAADHEP